MSELKNYFIKKGGYYYRPNSCGYTERVHQAGLYTKEEAQESERLSKGDCVAILAVDKINVGELISIKNNIDALLALEKEQE